MFFSLWETGGTQHVLAAHVGDHDTIRGKTKESISLGRKEQKMLASVSKLRHLDVQFQRIDIPEVSKSYVLDFVRYKGRPYDRRLPNWPENTTHRCFRNETNPIKEKVKLDGPSLEILRWIQEALKTDLQFAKVEASKSHTLKSIIVESRHIMSRKKSNKYSIKFMKMPSALEHHFSNLADETPTDVSPPYCAKVWRFAPKPLLQEFTSFYLIPRINPPAEEKTKTHRKSTVWVFNTTLRDCDGNLKHMYGEFFDLGFDALDFFKLKLPAIEPSIKSARHNQRSYTKAWKIPRDLIKGLEWSPLSKSQKLISGKLESWDDLSGNIITQPDWSLTFQKVPYGSINLININKSLSTFEIHASGRRTPNCTAIRTGEQTSPTFRAHDGTTSRSREFEDDGSRPNTSLIAQRTSLIDEDLQSLLQVKRRKLISAKVHHREGRDTQLLSVKVLRSLNEQPDDRTENDTAVTRDGITHDFHDSDTSFTAFDAEDLPSGKKFILINLSRLKQNHRVIQFLASKNELRLVEQEQNLAWDFILNPNTCVVRLQLSKFFQMNSNRTLFYENTLASLIAEFRKIIILLEYDIMTERSDPDIFWKVRQFLSKPEFETYFISDHYESVGMWVCMLTSKHSYDFNDQAFDYATEEEQILLAFDLNKFQTKMVLTNQRLPQLLLMAKDDRSHDLLMSAQRQRLFSLLLLEW